MRFFLAASLILCIFVISCATQTRLDSNSEQLKRILKIRYNDDDRKVNRMLKKISTEEKTKNDFARKTFTDEKLKQFFETNLGDYEKWYLGVRKLWDDFKTQSIKWFPHLSVFIDDFIEKFLWHAKIEEYKIKQFTATKQGMQMLMPYVKDYVKNATNGDLQIYEANKIQIRDILEKDFNLNGPALEKFAAQQEKKCNKLCYNEKYLFDRASLKTVIAPTSLEICANSINAEKEKHLSADDETKLEKMKKYFEKEECAAREICSQNSSTAMDLLEVKLKPYIAWFRKVSEGKELDGNENIKDEIDTTVFDLIDKILKQKNNSDTNIKCIIDYMKRNQSVDKLYSSDLLFDEDKLTKKTDPIVLEYKKQYPGLL